MELTTIRDVSLEEIKEKGLIDFDAIREFDEKNFSEAGRAQRALARLLDYCEEIDLHIPEEERSGYDMFEDYTIISNYLWTQETINDRNLNYSIDEMNGKLKEAQK